MNNLKTIALMTLMTVVLVLVGQQLGGTQGMVIALVMAGAMNLISYWFSDKIALMSYRARQVSEAEAPELYAAVRGLATRAGIPMPKVHIIPSASANAFATGRNPQHASVAVTEGIMRLLDREELEGVIAHELAHIGHRDILIATLVATLAGAITMLARMAGWAAMFGGHGGRDNNRGGGNAIGLILMMVLAPIAALLVQMWISRTREYEADAGGARIAGSPYGLASALEKLSLGAQARPMNNASPSSAHMFIVNPLTGRSLMNLFSTHPPLEERVARLRAMSRG
jgi:heat shock protein HtpX